MQDQNTKKFNLIELIIVVIFIVFFINPILGSILVVATIIYLKKNPKFLSSYLTTLQKTTFASLQKTTQLQNESNKNNSVADLPSIPKFLSSYLATLQKTARQQKDLNKGNTIADLSGIQNLLIQNKAIIPTQTLTILERRKKYLHIALNSTLEEAQEIISQLPISDRILIEAGTPLIKIYGTEAISQIKSMAPFGAYIVADNKCADLAPREVEMMAIAGANAATCLGVAPIETIDSFIEECQKFNIDSMLDMMNVENSLAVLKKLKKLPDVVMLHRGVDESEFSKEKQIPFYQIKQIKGNYNVLVAVAGGDTIKEVQRAIFNDADIVVVWKSFFQSTSDTAKLAEEFLKEIK